MSGLSLERAREAKRQLAERFDALPQLRGIGVAVLDDGYGVKLNLSELPGDCTIPSEIDGVPVVVEIVGRIEPL